MSDYTEEEVPRRTGRDVIDLIRVHAGLPPCRSCGERSAVETGRIALADVLFDGSLFEAVVHAEPVDPSDPDGDMEVTPLAIVVDDDLANLIRFPEPDDE